MSQNYPYEVVNQEDSAQLNDQADTVILSAEKLLYNRTSNSIRHRLIYLLLGGTAVILSFFLGSLLHPVSLPEPGLGSRPPSQDHSGLRAFIPDFSIESTTFEFNWTFAEDPSKEVTAAWESLIPKGQGAIKLPVRNEFDSEIYNIAGYHALHCLVVTPLSRLAQYSVREYFFALYRISTSSSSLSDAEAKDMIKHGRHCFEYMRQSLMCNPDLTLEPVEVKGGQLKLKQWGVERRCMNYGELANWAQEMRSSDKEGILE
ncbi:hypothetical protein F4775DRAFT_587374 [Biscogniauxia sp. FL1348]|nr:hypothetical protein F4775DRAFT_587374 [Biscogniauxia sp. FL1348]